jgi:hypothetical protein
MADNRLDRGAAFRLASDRFGDAAQLAADPDAELLFVIVAAVAPGLRRGRRLSTWMRRVSTPVSCSSSAMTGPIVCPSNGLPCSALACSTNWPPLGLVAEVAIDTLHAGRNDSV